METNKKRKININKQYIIDGSVSVIFSAFFAYSLYFLQSNTSSYLSVENSILSKQTASQQNDITISQFQKSNIAKINLLDSLPTQDSIVNWINQEEIMAQVAGVTQTTSFTNGELTKNNIVIVQPQAGNIPLLNANIVIRGTYNNILSYIDLLNNNYYYTRINSISISTAGSQIDGKSTVTASINLDLFVKEISQNVGN